MAGIFSTATRIWAILSLFIIAPFIVLAADDTREGAEIKLIFGQAMQGALMIFQTRPDMMITLDGTALPVSPEGRFAIGFHRDDTAAIYYRPKVKMAGQPASPLPRKCEHGIFSALIICRPIWSARLPMLSPAFKKILKM